MEWVSLRETGSESPVRGEKLGFCPPNDGTPRARCVKVGSE